MSESVHLETVRAGYDTLGPRFGEWGKGVVGDPWERFLDEVADRLPDGARLLDLGCGNGAKLARIDEHLEVVGVDLSEEQLRLARVAVPGATLVCADFEELDFGPDRFDAVTALYSIVHVPKARHPELFRRIRSWLRPGGLFLASLSVVGGPDRTETWLGVEMFFSGWNAETNARHVRDAGFELLVEEVISMYEPGSECETAFLWVLAQRPLPAVVD